MISYRQEKGFLPSTLQVGHRMWDGIRVDPRSLNHISLDPAKCETFMGLALVKGGPDPLLLRVC
jgi:hypothetical protein